MNTKLVVFDVDGVILDTDRGSTKDILVQLGKAQEVEALHQEYLRRRSSGPWGLEEIMMLFRGYSREELMRLARTYCASNLMEGASDTIQELKRRSYIVGSITSAVEFVSQALSELLPLDWIEATTVGWNEGVCIGEIERKVDRYTKREILENYMRENRISKQDVVIIGDSITDVPVSECAREVIAFNASDSPIIERADIHITKKNLTHLLSYL